MKPKKKKKKFKYKKKKKMIHTFLNFILKYKVRVFSIWVGCGLILFDVRNENLIGWKIGLVLVFKYIISYLRGKLVAQIKD
jgi:hypothetical protein